MRGHDPPESAHNNVNKHFGLIKAGVEPRTGGVGVGQDLRPEAD